jgi:cytochrome b involved in lipid metabolism
VYDVGEYANEHPGGSELIENEYGKNIDEPFEEAEHTKSARNIFKDLPVVGKMKESDTSSTDSSNGSPSEKKQGLTGLYGNNLNSKL